jgi:glycosyltransferase involved in cell wall biosynthesis
MRCLLAIPAFHESQRLPKFLGELLAELDAAEQNCDVQVVDDGSGEEEQARLQEISADLRRVHPRLLLPCLLPRNVGKGGAVREGLKQAGKYDWVGFVDADGAVPAYEVCRLLDLAREPASPGSALFASRIRMLGRYIERSALRHLTGRAFACLVGMQITPDIYDSQCGLKLLPAAAYQRVQPLLQENGFSFDVELLAALLAAGVRIEEVPIDWMDKAGSKVSLFRDTWRMFVAVRRINLRRKTWTL